MSRKPKNQPTLTKEEFYREEKKYNAKIAVRYFINEESKTVVCKLRPLYDGYPELLDLKGNAYTSFYEYADECNLTFIGKAKCKEPDVFDVALGKKIAYDKAMSKLLKSKQKLMKLLVDDLKNSLEVYVAAYNAVVTEKENVDSRLKKKLEELE